MTNASVADQREALAEQLVADGALTDPQWRDAFATVPREIFVPYFFVPRSDACGWRLVESGPEWRTGVYADDALVTQLNGDESALDATRRGDVVEGQPTSSSSAPTLMVRMLEALSVEPGLRVLEVGTGTGYNAALLSYRLGSESVTTVEVDAALSARAATQLKNAGFSPTVTCADGWLGHAAGAPYDRIIATVAVSSVPATWLAQTRPGAVLVVPLRFAAHGGLVAALTRDNNGGASGRFITRYGGFMPTRDSTNVHHTAPIKRSLLQRARPTEVPPGVLTGNTPGTFFLSLHSPCAYQIVGFTPDTPDAAPQTWGYGEDGSSFVLTTINGGPVVADDGPLWAALEQAYLSWEQLGRPGRERFGVTVRADGHQEVWFDAPA